jgi:hypothetical protein
MRRASFLLATAAIVGMIGCSAQPAEEDEAGEESATSSEDALIVYKNFTQRYMCSSTPMDGDRFCRLEGYDGGKIVSTSSCRRIDDFSVKDVTYRCRTNSGSWS